MTKKKDNDNGDKSELSRSDLERINKLEVDSKLIQDERLSKIELKQSKVLDQIVEFDKKLENIYKKFDQIRLDIKETYDSISNNFEKTEKKIFDIDERNSTKFNLIDHKLDTGLSRALTMFVFMMGSIIGLYTLFI